MEEQELYELFDVEPEKEDGDREGENGQEVAEPATDGENGQEVAEPAQPAGDEEQPGEAAAAEQKTEETSEQSREERARHAAARRRAETKTAIEQAMADQRAALETEYNGLIASLGLPNPYKDGETIRTIEELRAYKQQFDDRSMEERLAGGQISPEDIRKVVEQMPVVKEAAAAVQKAKEAEAAAQSAAFEAEVRQQLDAIHALDPSVNSLEDILAMDTAPAFTDAVRRHSMNYLEAFRYANMDRLAMQRQEAARREAATAQRGKDHMRPVSSRGSGAVTVPDDEMELYRQLNPDATAAEIQRHYNKHIKSH